MNKTFFAPQLFIKNGVSDISFYTKAFGAKEKRRFENADGSIHVAELSIGDAVFHIHEVTAKPELIEPGKYNSTTVLVGLFVENVDEVMARAIAAGATEISPATSYEYGYRQGEIRDPFGHLWLIEMAI